MTQHINATIIGASGYTGAELVRLLLAHPNVAITQLIAERNAGKEMSELYGHFTGQALPQIIALNEAKWENCDVAFCCLPHATTHEIAKTLPKHVKIIDLSADFRLYDTETYETWYGVPHNAQTLQKEAVYGLSEWYREKIAQARLIACPGCYPTSATLPLIPLVKAKAIDLNNIIIDAKSGVSGAGRSTKQHLLYTECNDSITAYSIAQHRHMPEIEQTLSEQTKNNAYVTFTPHLTPMSRGILSTIYVTTTGAHDAASLKNILEESYKNENFVHVLPDNTLPATKNVAGSNFCHINVVPARQKNTAVIVSAIDNLIKGASGQAVQNMNINFGLEETLGLTHTAVFP